MEERRVAAETVEKGTARHSEETQRGRVAGRVHNTHVRPLCQLSRISLGMFVQTHLM